MSDNYSELSIKLTKNLNKSEKKDNGIYFTPPKTITNNLKLLEPYMKDIKDVLEPSCGSCEFINTLSKNFEHLQIDGIEFNKKIYESIKSIHSDKINICHHDFLKFTTDKKYDLIIGNPPYYVMKKKDVDDKYHDYFEGRPNIFILFVIRSLGLLRNNGILSFILPKNFMNCLYYDKTRKYIYDNFQILNIVECEEDYIETKQETVILIVQKIEDIDNQKFCLVKQNYTIFLLPENLTKINELYQNSTTLKELKFKVKVGNVVWNQCKKELTDDKTKTLLIYSSDIKSKKLSIQTYSNKEKKNYINKEGEKGPLLVINRGYGVGSYSFDYCLLDTNFDYLIENHLICIRYTKQIKKEKLIDLYQKIIKSFEDPRTQKFIDLYFCNNAINTTEICEVLPIYDI
mgnify:CR=1 FL=1